MKGDQIPDQDHIARYCSYKRLSDDGQPQSAAFMLKPERPGRLAEESLSVNWLKNLECPDRISEIAEIQRIYRETFDVGVQAKIAVLNVGEVREKVQTESPDRRILEVLHDPKQNDPSHSEIYNLRQNDQVIAELIAETVRETYSAR
ncbi:MAG: hypothetical protein HQ543_00870 [Bacteroidetes bacterium]|nr:hypothetical protein [Bacteroidota bacterium]